VEFFENQNNVKNVGENTEGSVHFGTVGHVVLPNSHIIVQIATDFWKYIDGRYIEKIGYKPTISVAPGYNAMGAALAEIQK
jgi:C-terminal processing protease CtpA/Prc